jgi:hypothetical protein
VPAHLVGRTLEVAEALLNRAGVPYKIIPLHGHVKAADNHWGVCEIQGAAGSSDWYPSVALIVGRLRCGAS